MKVYYIVFCDVLPQSQKFTDISEESVASISKAWQHTPPKYGQIPAWLHSNTFQKTPFCKLWIQSQQTAKHSKCPTLTCASLEYIW